MKVGCGWIKAQKNWAAREISRAAHNDLGHYAGSNNSRTMPEMNFYPFTSMTLL